MSSMKILVATALLISTASCGAVGTTFNNNCLSCLTNIYYMCTSDYICYDDSGDTCVGGTLIMGSKNLCQNYPAFVDSTCEAALAAGGKGSTDEDVTVTVAAGKIC